ncbi:MAG: DNA recombination protein RmuC [Alphaproteobacteria bacterium]
MSFTPELALLIGIIVGAAAGFFVAKKQYGNMHSDRDQLLEDKIRLEAEKNALSDSMARQKQDLSEMEKKFTLQFENLANRIFDEKSAAFKKQSQEGLGTLLNPLKDKLQEFQKKVDDSFGQQAKEQYSLKNEIKNIVAVNEKMSQQTESLTKALKGDVKAQGNWGEVMLEKILEESGLRRNQDYILQGTELGLKDADGRQQKPDVIVKLPDAKHIIVDAKVSLTHYERYCGSSEETGRAVALKEFLNSLRAHVTGLEQRRYQDTDKLGAPDFVLMFLPIEGAYSLAVQEDTGLHAFAWERRIIIVTPTTLFTTLRTVASLWRIEMQNRNTLEIARQGGLLYDKVAGFVKDMEDLGKKLGQASETYDKAFKNLSTGPGNIVKRTEDLKALGVKTTKSLPKGGEDEEADDTVTPLKTVENG